ncbi:MAG: hypothetical protein ACM31H_01025 [Nitrososphaerales archaeon]
MIRKLESRKQYKKENEIPSRLRYIKRGDTIYTINRSEGIDVVICDDNKIIDITLAVARFIGYTLRREKIIMRGTGYNKGYEIVYTLGEKLFGSSDSLKHMSI